MSDIALELNPVFAHLRAACCMSDEECGCICGGNERVLRAFIREELPPMTSEQREWCLDEIGRVEGYDADDYRDYKSADLASTVLHAWTDFCRDKGLL